LFAGGEKPHQRKIIQLQQPRPKSESLHECPEDGAVYQQPVQIHA